MLCAFCFWPNTRPLSVVGRQHRMAPDREVVTISGNLRKLPDDVRIDPAVPRFGKKSLQRFFGREGAAVRPLGSEGIINIRNLQNPRLQRDVFSGETVRISAAVHFFMVMPNYGKDLAQRLQRLANIFAGDGMLFNYFSFSRVEWPGF